jgi:hypothetical protein
MQFGSPSHVISQVVSQAEVVLVIAASLDAGVTATAVVAAASELPATSQQMVPFPPQLMDRLMTDRH